MRTPTLYLASDPDTALLEVNALLQWGDRRVLPGARPMVTIQVKVRLHNVIDLRVEAVRQALGTSLQELTGNWRLETAPPTHVLGEAVSSMPEYDGLRAPSAKDPTKSILIVFTTRLSQSAGTFCEVCDGGSIQERIPAPSPDL